MPRRGENIRKRSDGRWEARYIRGYKPDGKAQYGYLYARTYLEVKRKQREAIAGSHSPRKSGEGRMPLSDAMEAWLKSRAELVRQSTLAHYAGIVYKHLSPALGGYPLCSLDAAVIE